MLLLGTAAFFAPQTSPGTRVLVVGGGPDLSYNQVGIESNVRYVDRLLGSKIPHHILFADGKTTTETVLYTDQHNKELHRMTKLTQIDGASQAPYVKQWISTLGKEVEPTPAATAVLYFTGHGGGDPKSGYANNHLGMWYSSPLTVKDLCQDIQAIPSPNPVVVIMVQCFSGGFGNLIFEDADPKGPIVDRDICGFFSAIATRMSAGCYPTTNEADYKDFTGYFFAALSGTTRMGKTLAPPDYDHDGRTGMDEAYAYSLINDDSIDTPVCTSDVFLRRYVKMADADVESIPFSNVMKWATPAQGEVLRALSSKLDLAGESRAKKAMGNIDAGGWDSDDDNTVLSIRFLRVLKSVVLAHQLRVVGKPKVIARFDRLITAEARNPLEPAPAASSASGK